MKLLMFGGTKFIGRAVVERAVELGHNVMVFHRGEIEPDEMVDVPHIHGDNLNVADHMDQINEFDPDSAIDTTQFDTPRTQAVVDALTDVVDRYVLVSSMDVYLAYGRLHRTEPGPYQESPRTEESALRTKPGFDHTDEFDNLHIERVALGQDALDVTITRLPGVFGPNDYQRRIGSMIDKLTGSDGEVRLHPMLANFHWTWGYVENIADMLIECSLDRRPGTRIYNLGYDEALSYLQMHELVANVIGWDGRILVTEEGTEVPVQDFGQQWGSDISKFRNDFGYIDRYPIEEAFRLTAEGVLKHRSQDHD